MSMLDSKEQVTFELLTLSREAGEPDNPWDKINNHYFLYYDYGYQTVCVDFEWERRYSTIYFPTEADVDNAIAEVGIDRIIKYYFGITDQEGEPDDGNQD